jgi:hypothetical protein
MKEYFSHDYGARNDRKITRLVMKHGMQGIGIFWCIVEMLYEEGGYLPLEYERITFELRTEYELVKSVIHDFDLFKIEGELFYSESVLERLNERSQKSEKARESINKRWEKYRKKQENTNVIRMYNERNTIKVKESKEKNNIFTPPQIEDVKKYCEERNNDVDAEKWFNFYTAKGWLIGKNKMKDWQAAVRTWEKKEYKNETDYIPDYQKPLK